MIWLAIAIMTAGVALCLVWPLAGRAARAPATAVDVTFYRSQLEDVGQDIARGTLAPTDAEATRTEIARRLLAAARRDGGATGHASRAGRLATVALAVAVVPALALGLYLHVGRPDAPDQPLAGRATEGSADSGATIPRMEAHLAAHPEDGRGHALLAPVYMRLGRFDDAARAYMAALAALGENAALRAGLGEAQMAAADGVVTREARDSFARALAADPKLPQARFFEALAAEQDGDRARATALFGALAAETPADAPWRPNLERRLAALAGPPTPAAAAVAALPPAEQRAAIAGMVEGLAGRLEQDGRDPDGWLRLVRAYTVMGEEARARTALADAARALAGDPAGAARVTALGRELKLEGEAR